MPNAKERTADVFSMLRIMALFGMRWRVYGMRLRRRYRGEGVVAIGARVWSL